MNESYEKECPFLPSSSSGSPSSSISMAYAAISAGMDVNLKTPPPLPFISRRLLILCTTKATPQELQTHHSSLSDQLKPLSATNLSSLDKDQSRNLFNKSKSIWVNPTKPRRSVLSLQRHKRSSPASENPRFRDLTLLAKTLSDCVDTDADADAAFEQIPSSITRDDAILILKSLKPWRSARRFLAWLNAQNSFPMETIFYNLAMKSLRKEKQFDAIEDLAREMIANEIDLDNITYSTIITSAKRCNHFDKAVEWFERMYKTGIMPDEVTYSAVLDVYAKLGKVEDAMAFYDRGRASGWKPDPIAFSILGKMFGEARDRDGIDFVLEEMKSVEVQPHLGLYNTLLEAMGRVGRPGTARILFQEMVDSGVSPSVATLTILFKMYGRARWGREGLDLWEKIQSNKWPKDIILYNVLLSMCAETGLENEAEKFFEEMKVSSEFRPNSWSYTAMVNMYGKNNKAEKALTAFKDMMKLGFAADIIVCTSLIQCLGRANRIDDSVKVFNSSIQRGMKPDDKLCGSLLSVIALSKDDADFNKLLTCLQASNPKLSHFLNSLQEKNSSLSIEEEFKSVFRVTSTEARRPFCNCLIDICRNRDMKHGACELLRLGRLYGLYPDLESECRDERCLNVQFLSLGAAMTALEEWVEALKKAVAEGGREGLPARLCARTGTGSHRQGLSSALASRFQELDAPFKRSEENATRFVAAREELVSWIRSKDAGMRIGAAV